MRIGIIGVNHKLADLKLREQLAKTCQKLFTHYRSESEGQQFILLSTCNRTEIYFSANDLSILHSHILTLLRQDIEEEFDQKLYSFFGIDCFLHLTKVASGFDSAILGETEILGQVKQAYESTRIVNTLSKDLHFLFQKSLAIAKKVRTKYPLQRGGSSLEHAIYQSGKEYFPSNYKPKILFIGASEINQKIWRFLINKNEFEIFLCNRTHAKAEALAMEEKIGLIHWDKLNDWMEYDWLVFGTKSPSYLLKWSENDQNEVFPQNKLIIDLGVPRNVDPQISVYPKTILLNIDEINNKLKNKNSDLLKVVEKGENRIHHDVQLLSKIYLEKENSKVYKMQFTA